MSSSEKRKLPVVILWPSFSPDLFRHESISEFRNLNFHKTIELILRRDRFVELLWFWTCSLTLQPTRTTNDEIASRSPQDIDVPTVLDFQIRFLRPENHALYPRSLLTNHVGRGRKKDVSVDFRDGNEFFKISRTARGALIASHYRVPKSFLEYSDI